METGQIARYRMKLAELEMAAAASVKAARDAGDEHALMLAQVRLSMLTPNGMLSVLGCRRESKCRPVLDHMDEKMRKHQADGDYDSAERVRLQITMLTEAMAMYADMEAGDE